jgi:hypothetical protein
MAGAPLRLAGILPMAGTVVLASTLPMAGTVVLAGAMSMAGTMLTRTAWMYSGLPAPVAHQCNDHIAMAAWHQPGVTPGFCGPGLA